jgi:hypothetical protein
MLSLNAILGKKSVVLALASKFSEFCVFIAFKRLQPRGATRSERMRSITTGQHQPGKRGVIDQIFSIISSTTTLSPLLVFRFRDLTERSPKKLATSIFQRFMRAASRSNRNLGTQEPT